MGWYDAIAGKGLRGFALDCRGHGESAKPHDPAQYDRAAMAKDVFTLMDHAGVERAHLLGFSMGAHIALTAAMADGGRIDHLVVAGVGGRIFEPGREPDAMAKAMEAASPDEIADPMLKSFRHFADEQKEDRLALAACSRAPRSPVSRDALMAIRRPTLVIAGARDQLAGPPQGLADAIPGAKAVVIPGCDHFSMIAHGLFKASVFDFFDGWLE
jgi:pimeloyl-ACP methyl ester carboxylesterase